jgi:polyketide cyclase/dehydrase/lipid transport protein
MSTDRFRHAFRVAAPPAVVYPHLMDPHSYIGLSPLVVAVRDIRRPAADTVAYVAIERFRFGPLKLDNPIRVTMTGTGPHERVLSTVVSPGWVRLISTVDLAADGTGTSVTESIELRAPWFLRRFALGQAKNVQRARAAELTRRMAAG